MKKMYLNEVRAELDRCPPYDGVFTEEGISILPEPVQRYFRHCGYIGREMMTNAKIIWNDVNFKLSPDKPWIKIKYEQYNFVCEPSRFAYIYSKMFGIIPFEGRDKYLDGQGNMLGRLAGLITMFNATGREINISAAVTYLSECLLVPACALQDYINWEPQGPNQVKAIFEYKQIKVEGIFTFDNDGKFIKFETDERYMDNGKSKPERYKWSVVLDKYIEMGGIKIPSRGKAVWNLPDGDYEYFNGNVESIVYNYIKAD